jgi:hypothetical protein
MFDSFASIALCDSFLLGKSACGGFLDDDAGANDSFFVLRLEVIDTSGCQNFYMERVLIG